MFLIKDGKFIHVKTSLVFIKNTNILEYYSIIIDVTLNFDSLNFLERRTRRFFFLCVVLLFMNIFNHLFCAKIIFFITKTQ